MSNHALTDREAFNGNRTPTARDMPRPIYNLIHCIDAYYKDGPGQHAHRNMHEMFWQAASNAYDTRNSTVCFSISKAN